MVTCGMTLHLFRKLDGYDDLVKVINRRPTNPPLCAKEEKKKISSPWKKANSLDNYQTFKSYVTPSAKQRYNLFLNFKTKKQ